MHILMTAGDRRPGTKVAGKFSFMFYYFFKFSFTKNVGPWEIWDHFSDWLPVAILKTPEDLFGSMNDGACLTLRWGARDSRFSTGCFLNGQLPHILHHFFKKIVISKQSLIAFFRNDSLIELKCGGLTYILIRAGHTNWEQLCDLFFPQCDSFYFLSN